MQSAKDRVYVSYRLPITGAVKLLKHSGAKVNQSQASKSPNRNSEFVFDFLISLFYFVIFVIVVVSLCTFKIALVLSFIDILHYFLLENK